MALQVKTVSLLNDDSAVEMSPEDIKTPKQLRLFQENFDKHMSSMRKPKQYEHVAALLLSFDSTSTLGGLEHMDVSDEVRAKLI